MQGAEDTSAYAEILRRMNHTTYTATVTDVSVLVTGR